MLPLCMPLNPDEGQASLGYIVRGHHWASQEDQVMDSPMGRGLQDQRYTGGTKSGAGLGRFLWIRLRSGRYGSISRSITE